MVKTTHNKAKLNEIISAEKQIQAEQNLKISHLTEDIISLMNYKQAIN